MRPLLLSLLLPSLAWAEGACPTEAWQQTLASQAKTITMVQSIAKDLVQRSAQAPDACRVALFEAYWTYYAAVRNELTDELMKLDSNAPRRREIEAAIKPLGWKIHDQEEGTFIAEGNDWLLRHAGQRLPNEWQRYVAMILKETREGFVTDESFLIDLGTVRLRIRTWEDFLIANPRFPHRDEIARQIQVYLIALLVGVDNAPAFHDGVLTIEARREIAKYVADPKAARRVLVGKWLRLVKANRYRETDAARELLEENQLTWLSLPRRKDDD